jgi:hypothetical protein
MQGKVGAAVVPGVTRVWDRDQKVLRECDQDLCPYAQRRKLLNGSTVLVNYAPWKVCHPVCSEVGVCSSAGAAGRCGTPAGCTPQTPAPPSVSDPPLQGTVGYSGGIPLNLDPQYQQGGWVERGP